MIEPISLLDGRLLLLQYPSILTVDDITTFVERYRVTLDGVPSAKIHVIHDTRDVQEVETGMSDLTEALYPVFIHPKLGWSILIAQQPNQITQLVTINIATLARIQYRVVPSLQDGYKFVQKVDMALSDVDLSLPLSSLGVP
jgi:hypothetical protein